jgi:hypothetical protein
MKLKKVFHDDELKYLKHSSEIINDTTEVTTLNSEGAEITYNRLKWWDLNNLTKVNTELRNL